MTNIIPKFSIIIGAMKSGTSSLFSILAQHPEISACNEKEPEFFVRDHKYEKGLKEYYKLWDFDHDTHKLALEASTSYTKIPNFPNAAERIKNSGINVKVIYIMRQPIERIRSQMQMSHCKGWKVFDDQGRIHNFHIAFSKYHMQISEYYKLFLPEQILLLSFENFIKDPKYTLKQVCKFLGIDDTFNFILAKANKHDSLIYLYQNTLILRKLFGIYSYEEYFDYLKNNKNKYTNQIFKWYLRNINKLKLSQIRYIKSELADDIRRLQIDFGFKASDWKI